MFQEEKIITVQGASINELWDTHSDVANWAKWQKDIEWTKVEGEVRNGTKFTIKPKSGPKVDLEVVNFDKLTEFTDVSYLPMAKMYTTTTMKEVENGVEIKLTIVMKGLLTFLWKNLVAKGILKGHEQQNLDMVEYINKNRG